MGSTTRVHQIGIYKIQSISQPEKFYIGSSIDIFARWYSHKLGLKRNKHHSVKLQEHYNKYGLDDLIFTILIECDKRLIAVTEQSYLDDLKPYFNTATKATSSEIAQNKADFWAYYFYKPQERRWKEKGIFYFSLYY